MYQLDKSLWKLNDRDWLKQRKQEWREVKTNLGNMSIEIERKAHKYHKDYFLTGELDPMIFASVDEQIFNNFPTVFAGGRLFFDIWYVPDFDLERFQDIFDNEDHEGDLWRARDFLFRFNQSEFSTPYGMMGGAKRKRLKFCFRTLIIRK